MASKLEIISSKLPVWTCCRYGSYTRLDICFRQVDNFGPSYGAERALAAAPPKRISNILLGWKA